jgi:hypothetical protein
MTIENKIRLSTLGTTNGKSTAEVAEANGLEHALALAELKRRSKPGGDVARTGNGRATTKWLRAA